MPRKTIIILLACVLGTGCGSTHTLISAPDVSDDMQFVAGGTYRMGTDMHDLQHVLVLTGMQSVEPLLPEVPSREVTVEEFWLDTFDVSNQRFHEFVESVPKWRKEQLDLSLHNGRYLEHWIGGRPPTDELGHPVTFITWQAAVAYCAWRGKRLPSEAEYEWAAQDGTSSSEYPWGDSPPRNEIVNWGNNEILATVPVGSYAPNARGLYDMAGNVWHFTSDPWLGSDAEMLTRSRDKKRDAADAQIRRVVRGGSWGANAANLRVRYRDSHRPFDAREMVGFRCAKTHSAN